MRLSGSGETLRLDVSTEELEALVEQARAVLPEDGYQKLLGAVHTLRYVTELLENKEASLANLRERLGPATTEKTEKVLTRIAEITTRQLQLIQTPERRVSMELDRELENAAGEKERLFGALRQHRAEHGC